MALSNTVLVWINIGLILALITRVVWLRLGGVFRLLLLLLSVNLLFMGLTSVMKIEGSWARYHLDYRLVFALGEALELAITACIVFALLRSFMSRFPGILKLSRTVLWAIVFVSLGLGVAIAVAQVPLSRWIEVYAEQDTPESIRKRAAERKELETAKVPPSPVARENRLRHSVFLAETLDQTVTTVLLLALLSMLAFLFWFPVDVPRNAVVFSAGYIIFFAIRSLALFFRYFSPDAVVAISLSIQAVSAVCYLYWLFFLTPLGETVPVRLGHRWKPQEQERLLGQLGAINTTLLRSARRS